MYRPTVRYSDSFREYIDRLFNATHLDRNQLLRAALFAAAHSKEFQSIVQKYKKCDVTLPQAHWGREEERLWKEQNYIPKTKKIEPEQTQAVIRVINQGGIKYVPKSTPLSGESVTV
jgi:hypothetical protein